MKLLAALSLSRCALFFLSWYYVNSLIAALASDFSPQTPANVMAEFTFTAARSHADPFNTVTLDAVFVDPQGKQFRVPAFWAGANVWKVRYASPILGTHRFRTECSDGDDPGLHHVAGSLEVIPYRGKNTLYAHGPLRVTSDRRFLEHADGTPFFWLGDTWWMGLCHRLHWPDEFKQLSADRVEKGFNVIQIVAGLYPDMPPFDPRGANEAGFPWSADYKSINPEYFNAADERFRYLVEQGLTPSIVGAWGYFISWMGVEKAQQHWRHLIARYGAWPVVWCVAGEANLPYYLAPGFPFDDRAQVKSWTEVTRYLRATDPFHRLITIHPTGINRLSARHAIDDVGLLDIDLLQTPHGQSETVAPTVRTVRESYADTPVMPVINGEASYEMLFDKIPARWPRAMFWVCLLNGAAGHTYGANGIWQCNRPDLPHGPSPNGAQNGVGYGKITWAEAMNLPGSSQVALGKNLLAQFPWQKFTPHPEWAAFTSEAGINLKGGRWIWLPGGKPAEDAPLGKGYFRQQFTLPVGRVVDRARLFASADDKFGVKLNGEHLGGEADWQKGRQFDDVATLLKPGRNVLSVIAENKPLAGPKNPAGLIVRLEIRFADGESLILKSDAAWRCAQNAEPGWEALEFDDAHWPAAQEIAGYGDRPWGEIASLSSVLEPQAAGIADRVRIVWVPRRERVLLKHLGAGALWSVTYFDPVSGRQKDLGILQADAAGLWPCEPPTDEDQDWVLVLQAKKQP